MGGLGFGLLPFISPVLEAQKNGGIREAGFIIAAQAFGSLLLSLALPLMLKFIPRPMMVIGGALMVAISLALFAMGWHWSVQMAIFVAFGFGWFMQHNTIQYEVSEISQEYRGSAYSMHAFFFFTGQFLGPIIYGQIIPALGTGPALTLAAIAMGLTGILAGSAFAFLSRKVE
jgi:MFS family permease